MPLTLDGTNGVSAVQAGAVESGDLASGAIGSGDLPAGSVIQVVQNYNPNTGVIATTSSTLVGSGVTVTITPTKIGNKIIIQLFNPMVDHDKSSFIRGRMFVNGSQMSGADEYHLGYQSPDSRYATWAFSGDLIASSLSSLTFEPFFEGDGANVRFSHPDSSIALIAMEVAQ